MSLASRIYDRLKNDAGITALVGSDVHSHTLPDNFSIASDAVVFTYSMDDGENTLDQDNVLEYYTLYVVLLSTNTDTLESIQAAVRACLDDYADAYLRDIVYQGDLNNSDMEKERYSKSLRYKITYDNN